MNLILSHDWATIYCDDYLNLFNNKWGFTDEMRVAGAKQEIFKNEETRLVGWDSYIPPEFFDPRLVRAYPQAYIGHRDRDGKTNLTDAFDPTIVANIRDMQVNISMNLTVPEPSQYNVALESYLHSTPFPDYSDENDTRRFEMMVWLHRPEDSTMNFGENRGVVVVGDIDYSVYTKPGQDNYIAFIAVDNQPLNASLNWKAFLDESRTIFPFIENLWLTSVEAGTEMWSGRVIATIHEFNHILRTGATTNSPGVVLDGRAQCLYDIAHIHALMSERHRELHDKHRELAKYYGDES